MARRKITREDYLAWVNDPNKHLCMSIYLVDITPAPYESIEECVFIEYSTGERGIVHHSVVIPRADAKEWKSASEIESARYWARIESFESISRYNDYISKDRS